MSTSIRPGDVLADRYRLEDLLDESRGARFWRAHDRILARHVAVQVIAADDERAEGLMVAARSSATVPDRRFLRVLDADEWDGLCFVVNEWGAGTSLDVLLSGNGPLEPRRAAWIAEEVAAAIAAAHQQGVSHGRLVPENVLLDHNGAIRVIGLAVDAALHGLPPGRRSADVVDLAGLLYAGLTGRWAGISPSLVPTAPVEAGRILSPRKVRAGIPRPLDTLCVQVLDSSVGGSRARAAYDLHTARGITDYLRDFVGDPTGLAAALAGGKPPTPAAHPPEPDEQPGADHPDAAPTAVTEPPAPAPPPVVEQPTEAGMPIFDDDSGDVSWLTARASRPPPPPPFEEPVARPLFAPDPPGGTPVRRRRPGGPDSTGTGPTGLSGTGTGSAEFWPWPGGDGTFGGTGSGSFVPVDEDDAVPGRRWLRLAMVLAAATLLLLGLAVIAKLGERGGTDDPGSSTSSGAPSATGGGSPITGLVAYDFDPQGDPPEENADRAAAAVDGDPATAWPTATYDQDLGPAGLKTGVGLTIDLGEVTAVRSAVVTVVGGPTTIRLFLTTERPTGVGGLAPVATETVDGRLAVDFDEGSTGRYLTVWLTSLPAVGGGFRGEIADVAVRG